MFRFNVKAPDKLYVIIFRDVLGFIKVDQRFFNRDQFLESMDYEDRPFYEKV